MRSAFASAVQSSFIALRAARYAPTKPRTMASCATPSRLAGTALTRDMERIETVASIVAMLLWLTLAFAILVTLGSILFAALKGLELFRGSKRLLGATGDGLDGIARSSGEIERHLQAAATSGTALNDSLARLQASRARLAVLTTAIDDVRASVGRVTGVLPRK